MSKRRMRTIKFEGLDQRFCFASDLTVLKALPEEIAFEVARHNHAQPTDVNVDGFTTALDALGIVNELNDSVSEVNAAMMADTNGDGAVSPLDALLVINKLNSITTDQQTRAPSEAIDKTVEDGSADGSDQTWLVFDEPTDRLETDMPADLASRTFDPTNDNGNGYFETGETVVPLLNSIEAELRRQLQLADSASIQVAVYVGGEEIRSGTWRYLTVDGLSLWGNWRQSPDELRLFLSNVEEENRIYGQYPDGSFVYYSWLEDQPVGFFFTPLREPAVTNPVPIEKYVAYFNTVEGSGSISLDPSTIDAFDGDVGTFSGAFPIEDLLRDLYAIQTKWLQGY